MQVNDLVVTGDARIIGNLYANNTSISGDSSGGGESGSGLTYSISKSGSTITLRGSDGSTSSVNDDNTTYSIGNGTVTVTQNGVNKGSFTLNQSGNATIALTDTTYSLNSLGAAPASHNHDAGNITSGTLPLARGGTGATSADGARSNIGAAPASHSHIELVNGTVGLKASDSNEISFKSNANYIYFGYDNRMGSSGIVTNYKFGTHSGASNASSGIIECGSVIEGGTALSSKYAPYSHSHNYAASSHTHDDIYYTESEINSKLNAITKYAY
jgi:hypothetical protein